MPLSDLNQFIIRDDKKVPLNHITKQPCDPHNPANWTDYETAKAAGNPGFVLTAADDYVCVDLDGCLQDDGMWSEQALEMCAMFPGALIELSQSGKGLHIWFKAKLPPNHRTRSSKFPGIEIYSNSRYIALGRPYDGGSADVDHTVPANSLIDLVLPGSADPGGAWTEEPDPDWSGPTDDVTLIAKMLGAPVSAAGAFGDAATPRDLWEGNVDVLAPVYPSDSGDAFDHSAADMALCYHLAFWTGKNCARMDLLFHESALYREKWDREDYKHRTIIKAVAGCKNVYSGGAVSKTRINARPEFPTHCLDVDGLFGTVCKWIDDTAPKPQPILTIAAVLASFGALFGGRYSIAPMDTRPNLYCCGIAPTGSGKDHARKCLINLFEKSGAGQHVMGGDVTSDSATLKALERCSSQVGFFDEIGMLLTELSGRNTASHKAGIISTFMKLYSSSGSVYKGTEYADRKRSRVDIVNPNLCIYGTTTEEPLFDAFSSKDAASGHLNRWLFFRGNFATQAPKLDFSGKKNTAPPDYLTSQIKSVVATVIFGAQIVDIRVNVSAEAQLVFDAIWSQQDQMGPLWIRYFENMVKVAGIRAIADNQTTPVISLQHAEWARDVVRWCIESMVYDVQRLVADNPYQKSYNRIRNLISEAGPNGLTLTQISRKTSNMDAATRNPILEHLVEAGQVSAVAEGKVVKRYFLNP